MSESNPNSGPFDVFLCHNSADKSEVREIAAMLRIRGLKPWLDERDISPGYLWQEALDHQIKTIKAAAILVGNNGIGQWQKEEIQSFHIQVKKRGCVIIPVILPSATATPELPSFLQIRQQVDFRNTAPDPYDCLKEVIIGQVPVDQVITETLLDSPADNAEKLDKAYQEGRRLYPPLVEAPAQAQRSQIQVLLNRVQVHWVDGVLKRSLHHKKSIPLGKNVREKAVEPPWKYAAPLPSTLRESLLHHRNITTLFDATALLLILGEPGSGKTTTLLELAEGLITRANEDSAERVPIVLNLSSWQKATSLEEWIAAELWAKYGVPNSIARAWIAQDYLVPLLDGLDELPTAVQPACVTAINAFVEDCRPSGLVVCSRLAEYEWLPKRLKLNSAICIEPLSSEDVNQFIEERGTQLAGLKEALRKDLVLQELSQIPLMLDIMSEACKGVSKEVLITNVADSVKMRQQQIFRLYVDEMFKRKESTSSAFEKEQTIGWLSWLARTMKEQSQSVFMVEGIQPGWLSSMGQRIAYEALVAQFAGLTVGLIITLVFWNQLGLVEMLGVWFVSGISFFVGCRTTSPVINGVVCLILFLLLMVSFIELGTFGFGKGLIFYMLLVGLFGGYGIGSLNQIYPVESLSWHWRRLWRKGFWIPLALLICLILSSMIGPMEGSSWVYSWSSMLLGLVPISAFIAVLSGGLVDQVRTDKDYPNHGVILSFKHGLIVLLIFGLIGIIVKVLWTVFYNERDVAVGTLLVGLGIGMLFGLAAGLNHGGSAVVKHYALRLILWLTGSIPLRFIPFLDHCAMLIFLKRVGGGYIFIHRTLLEYFTELPLRTSYQEKS